MLNLVNTIECFDHPCQPARFVYQQQKCLYPVQHAGVYQIPYIIGR